MKRTLIGLICLIALMGMALSASAEPVVTRGGYTAYLSADNYLYLQDPTGASKVLSMPIADIIDVTDAYVFCIVQDGRLIRIPLDGTQSEIVAAQPTQEQIDEVKNPPVYTLEGTVLKLASAPETGAPLSATAIMACTNSDSLFWIESDATGATVLKSLLLNDAAAVPQTIGAGVTAPLGLNATDEALTMVAGDHTVTVVTLIDMSRNIYPATSVLTARAVAIGGQLYRYSMDEATKRFAIEPNIDSLIALNTLTTAPAYTVPTSAPTATPTVRPMPTATKRPTATSAPSSSNSSSNGTLRKGESGSEIRKMQKRLSELGYPVGVIDGVWGDDTQLAVNLFQCAIGYTERDYATSGMLDKLYSKKAPAYNMYAPLKKGDKGTDVLIMQTTLQIMGYNPGKIDGIYGANTAAAISQLQKVAGLTVTGEADTATLQVLYSPDCPLNPDVYPPETPTPAPTDQPTAAPTDAPTNAPTDAPTNQPTQKPGADPTEAPTQKPTEKPTEAPTEKPVAITEVVIVLDSTKKPLTQEPKPGDKLTVKVQPENATFTCEWYYEDNETKILSTELVYEVTKNDVGKKLICRVTGTGSFTGTATNKDPIVATSTDLK